MNGSEQTVKEAKNDDQPRSSENLAFLYQGLLTIIVRLQAGREQIPEAQSFRLRAKKLLADAERDARRVGYDADDVKDTHVAVTAFLDSVVLHSSEAGRAEWERQSLAEELFKIPDAGEVFFDKIDDLRGRRDSQDLADVLEVYLLCLLLGFEGRYAGGLRGELSAIKEKVRRRIDDIRGKPGRLSPTGLLTDAGVRLEVPPQSGYSVRRLALIGLGAAVVTILCFILLKLDLVWEAERVSGRLL